MNKHHKTALLAFLMVGATILSLPSVTHALSCFLPSQGGTGDCPATNPHFGVVLVSNGAGKYIETATSSLGLGGSGTVTSVDVSGGTTGLTTTGGPITTNGTITISGTLSQANGGTGATSFGIPFYTFFQATTTDALAQGTTNLYWSNTLFDNRLSATTSLPNITTLANLGTVKTSLTGLLKAASGVLSAAANGTDYTLITAKTCNAGDFVSAVTAAGVFTCTTPAGTTYTGTSPIKVLGSVISFTGLTTTTPVVGGNLFYGSGVSGVANVATSTFTPNGDFTTTGTLGALVGGSASTLTLNTGTAHSWTVLQTFANASTTLLSASYASSTSAFFGTLNLPGITGTQCLHSVSGVVSGTGSDCGSGGGGSGVGTIATSTLEASGDIPFATTNSAYPARLGFSSNFFWDSTNSRLGISTSTPTYPLSVNGPAWFTNNGLPTIFGANTSQTESSGAGSGQDMGVVVFASSTATVRASAFTAAYDGSGGNVTAQGLNAFATADAGMTGNLNSAATNGGSLRNRYAAINNSVGYNVLNMTAVSAGVRIPGVLASTTNGMAFNVEAPFISAGNLMTNGYGLAFQNAAVSGTLTNYAGIAIPDLTSGTNDTNLLLGTSTNPTGTYDIFASSTRNNFFGGNIGLGTTSPYAQLSMTGNLVLGAAITGGTPGDLFLPKLGTAAGSFLAVDATGKVIATTTPSGGGSTPGGATQGVIWATTAVLTGTPTYSNGSSGVGATLTEVGSGALSVDGSSPAAADRVLVKNQANAFQNGIYTVTATGSGIASYVLTRSSDYNTATLITPGITTYVISGTANTDTQWAVSYTAPLTIGTTNLTYTEIAGGGASITSVANSDGTLTVNPTTGAVVASLALSHANTWTGQQIFNTANVGIGTSTPFSTLSINAAAGVSPWSVGSSTASSTLVYIDQKGHFVFNQQSRPSVTSCGTNPAVSGSDTFGQVKIGAGATACIFTPAAAFQSNNPGPHCVLVFVNSGGSATTTFPQYDYGTQSGSITMRDANAGGSYLNYFCADN